MIFHLVRLYIYIDKQKELERTKKSEKYWTNVPANHQSTFGSDKNLRNTDVNSTITLIDGLIEDKILKNKESVFEFAAGTGRVTEGVLTKYFNHIDVLEISTKLSEYLKILSKNKDLKIKTVYNVKAEGFKFEQKYDMIYGQGFLESLSDIEVLKHFINMRNNLNNEGIIIIKENISSSIIDSDEKGSRFRKILDYEILFKLSGLKLIKSKGVDGWKKSYLPHHEFVVTTAK